jgi:HTH-type transcriptional regulator, sugar sensing transcriptional regulator
MDMQILEDIGLTKGEIKVYLALLEQGPSTAGKILEKAQIQNSVFHFNINRLIEKGLVSYIKKGKVKIYNAANPDNFLSYLKDKEEKIKEILPKLKERQFIKKEKQIAELFDGTKGIMNIMNSLIEDTKRGDEFLFFPPDVDEKNKEIQEFFEIYDIKRKAKGLDTKGIVPIEMKELFKKRKYIKVKYAPFPTPANIGICNDKIAIISWDEKPTGVLIQSKQIAKKQKEFFHSLWKSIN